MAYNTVLEVHEVFEKTLKMKTQKEKVEFLRSQDKNSLAVRDICQAAHDDRVQFLLPKGPVPYTVCDGSPPSTLLRKHKDLTYFVKKGMGEKMPAYKREGIFIAMLESIHPKDAEIMVNVINKKTPAKGINKTIVQKAWPELGIK
tara:strand:+ start:317 stop:751 length:435 start_codon:yes stop_codon:yes gene_type:complete